MNFLSKMHKNLTITLALNYYEIATLTVNPILTIRYNHSRAMDFHSQNNVRILI